MMSKRNYVELLNLNQSNLEGFKVVDVGDDNITRLSSYNFLIMALETWNGRKFDKDERITELIKLNLPKEEATARKQWFEGVEMDGHTYVAWFSTSGGMKKEDEDGIAETFFIREDYIGFTEKVEDLISLKKFKELEGQEICINSDVLSRLSLITSDLMTEIDLPDTIILPETQYNYIEDYKTVKPNRYTEIDSKGKEVDRVDYELVDHKFEGKIEMFDGGGLATPKVFESIGKSLDRKDVEFAIIRAYGNATKGLITKFDIIEYLNDVYITDTDHLRRVDGEYYLMDMWNDWQLVTDNTMLLNESMVKLAKRFDSMQEYQDRLNNADDKYKNLLNKLYITKVNNKNDELNDYRRTNYQLINALALTPNDYKELASQDYKMLKKIIRPFDLKVSSASNKEFEANTDYIKLFFKNVVDENIDSNDVNYQEKLIEAIEGSIVDKTNELISLNEDFVKLDTVKKNLNFLVEKKIRELACGKVTVKGKYQYMACCPISYMNQAIYGNQGNNGLAKGQFYSADCENEDIRTISRNPLAAYSEIHNVEFVRNELLDKYLSSCRELIYFNQKSDIQNLLSGSDFDGDGILVVDNDIIKNAVVTPECGKYFINLQDGETKALTYNKENRFVSTFLASGNLIGKIALKAANVNSNCQNVPDYYDKLNGNFFNWKDVNKRAEELNKTQEELNEAMKYKLESGEYKYGSDANEELRQRMIDKFYEYEKEIYIILYNSMKSIDASKTLVFPDRADMEVIDKKYFKKSHFLQYKENIHDVEEDEYIYTYSMLDRFSKVVQDDLLKTIENGSRNFRDRVDVIQSKFKNIEYNESEINSCFDEVEQLYKDYTARRSEIGTDYSAQIRNIDDYRIHIEREFGSISRAEREHIELEIKEANKSRNKKYKDLDDEYLPLADVIIGKFDLATICQSIYKLKNCTENFILTLFFECFTFINTPDNVRFIYKKSDKGNIDYLHETYEAIPIKGFNNENVVERMVVEDYLKAGIYKKIRMRFKDKSIVREIEEAVESGRVYSLNLNDMRTEAYSEFEHMIENKDVIKVLDFVKRKNGRNSITQNSIELVIES